MHIYVQLFLYFIVRKKEKRTVEVRKDFLLSCTPLFSWSEARTHEFKDWAGLLILVRSLSCCQVRLLMLLENRKLALG